MTSREIPPKERIWILSKQRDILAGALERLANLVEEYPEEAKRLDISKARQYMEMIENRLSMDAIEAKACQDVPDATERRKYLDKIAKDVELQFLHTSHAK